MSETKYKVVDGTSFRQDTPSGLCNLLNDLRETRTIVRVFLGDTETGRCWNEEYDVIGRVGRSTGRVKIPLLVPRQNSYGGPALLDHCIVRIQETYTKAVLYQHPKFVMPEFIIVPTLQAEKYKAEVYHDAVIARFETVKKAENWVAFMRGERMKK